MSASPQELTSALSRVIGRQGGGGGMDLSALLPERMLIEAREGRRLRKALSNVSESAFNAAVETLAAGIGGAGARTPAGYRLQGGVAILDVRGVLSKEFSLWGLLFGGQACTERVLAMLNAAVDDAEAKRILVVFDTPGGEVRGIDELAEALFLARKVKPVIGFGSDRCMSGGMWLAAQCQKLYVSTNCWTGAIGVRIVMEDDERAELNAGIDRRVFGSTPAKVETPDSAIQQVTDDLAANFVAAIARGRGIPLAEAVKLADALPYVGERAVSRGLADGVTTLQALVGQLQEEIAAVPPGVVVDVFPPSNEDNELETGRAAGAVKTEPRAEGEGHLTAQKEDPMANEPTPVTAAELDRIVKAAIAPLSEKVEALSKENAELKKTQADSSSKVDSMTRDRELDVLLTQARIDVKLTKGNESTFVPYATLLTETKGIAAAKAWIDAQPKLGKGEGAAKPLPGAAATTPGIPQPRHRFDIYGPEACAKSTDPRMHEYAAQIEWISAAETASGTKFKNVTEAFRAYHAAHAGQSLVA